MKEDNMDQRELIKKMWDVSIKGTYQPEDERLLTLKETLAYLRIGRTTLYRFIDDKKIEGHKVGRLWRFYLGELRRFVNGKQPMGEVTRVANKDEQS